MVVERKEFWVGWKTFYAFQNRCRDVKLWD